MNRMLKTLPIGVLLAAGLGTRYDQSGKCLKLMQPVHWGKHAGVPIVAAAARNLKTAVKRTLAVDIDTRFGAAPH